MEGVACKTLDAMIMSYECGLYPWFAGVFLMFKTLNIILLLYALNSSAALVKKSTNTSV